jgi:hypothetical protein
MFCFTMLSGRIGFVGDTLLDAGGFGTRTGDAAAAAVG